MKLNIKESIDNGPYYVTEYVKDSTSGPEEGGWTDYGMKACRSIKFDDYNSAKKYAEDFADLNFKVLYSGDNFTRYLMPYDNIEYIIAIETSETRGELHDPAKTWAESELGYEAPKPKFDNFGYVVENAKLNSTTTTLWKKGNISIIIDGYGYGIDNGYTINRFIIDNDGKALYDYAPPKYIKDAVDRLIKQGKFDNLAYEPNDATQVKHTLKYGNFMEESTDNAFKYGKSQVFASSDAASHVKVPNDYEDSLDTLYDRACHKFGEDTVDKILVECGGPTVDENPDYWWTPSLDTKQFYLRLVDLFLNSMLNYEDFADASDIDSFAYDQVAETYGLPTTADLDDRGYGYDPQNIWNDFRLHTITMEKFTKYSKNESSKSTDNTFKYDDDKWVQVDTIDGYAIYRKVIDGRGHWKAITPEGDEISITYAQALGYEPITSAKKMSKELGKKLLPKINERTYSSKQEDWEEIDKYNEDIKIYLDADICVNGKNDWEYIDETCPWAEPDDTSGYWHGEEFEVYLANQDDIVDYVTDLIAKYIPTKSGTYNISGIITLVFEVTGIYVKYEFIRDPHDEYMSIEETNTDDADVYFDKDKSSVSNINIKKI